MTTSRTSASAPTLIWVEKSRRPVALALTTNLNINFLNRPEPVPLDGVCRILKLGRNLMVFEVDMVAGPDRQTVAHATGTYSIPPKR